MSIRQDAREFVTNTIEDIIGGDVPAGEANKNNTLNTNPDHFQLHETITLPGPNQLAKTSSKEEAFISSEDRHASLRNISIWARLKLAYLLRLEELLTPERKLPALFDERNNLTGIDHNGR
ncbi:hypothetical protein HY003_02425 [Candidatus Saccharibacteria bacterium]|nr:hypothetical protein [Candidatus Saccharibacteria bacterium]MBI3338132.1 hypothetical protein [Candidatus Saccharibacteria bacterium]